MRKHSVMRSLPVAVLAAVCAGGMFVKVRTYRPAGMMHGGGRRSGPPPRE